MQSPHTTRDPVTAIRRAVAAIVAYVRGPDPVVIPPNVERISNIPCSLLPDMSPERDALLWLAWHGCDVDAYQAAYTREWIIWCRPGEGIRGDGRYSIEQWKAIADRELARLAPPNTWNEEGC